MDLINHQSNGANGLRIAATVCIILGWISFVFCFITGCVANDVNFFGPFAIGLASLGVMYLTACATRALASLAEAAQLYYDNNYSQPEEDADE